MNLNQINEYKEKLRRRSSINKGYFKYDIIKKTNKNINRSVPHNKNKIYQKSYNKIINIGEIKDQRINNNRSSDLMINCKTPASYNKIKEGNNIISGNYSNNKNKNRNNIILNQTDYKNNIIFNDNSQKNKGVLYPNENILTTKKDSMKQLKDDVKMKNPLIISPNNLNIKFKQIEDEKKVEDEKRKKIEERKKKEEIEKKSKEEKEKKMMEIRMKKLEELEQKLKEETERIMREIGRKKKEKVKKSLERKNRKEEEDNERIFNQYKFISTNLLKRNRNENNNDLASEINLNDENNNINNINNININSNDLNIINLRIGLRNNNNYNNRNLNNRQHNRSNALNYFVINYNNRYNRMNNNIIIHNNDINNYSFNNSDNENNNNSHFVNNILDISSNNNHHAHNHLSGGNRINNIRERPGSTRKDKVGPIKRKILNLLPENKIKDITKLDEENKRCTICLEDFRNNDNVIFLPCFHIFHKKCIFKWIEKDATCPLCKININKIIK